jgi:hypothetical protein
MQFLDLRKEEYRHDEQNSNCGICYGFAIWIISLLFLQKGSIRDATRIDDRG